MARLLPGVYSAINDLSQFPEGAQTLNVGYIVQAERGPVNEWSLCTNPTDFLTKYTFSGKPDLTADPTFHSVIKVMAQTNAMYIVRAANNPLYGGAIVKKAQKYGPTLGVDQAEETFLLMIPIIKDEENPNGVEGPKPKKGESVILSGTGLFDGRYTLAEDPEDSRYTHKYTDEEGVHEYRVYKIKVAGEDPIAFSAKELGYSIHACGNDSGRYFFEVDGDITEDFEAFEGEDIVITVAGSQQEGSSGIGYVNNNGYYLVKPNTEENVNVVLREEEDEHGDPVYFTRFYIYSDASILTDVFKRRVEEITDEEKGQVFINSKFQGTSVYTTPIVPLSNFLIGNIYAINADTDEETGVTTKEIYLYGDLTSKFTQGDKIIVKGSPENEDKETNDGEYTVVRAQEKDNKTIIKVAEKLKFTINPIQDEVYGDVFISSLVNPEASAQNLLGEDDLMLLTGSDPGAYNGKEAFGIISTFDNKEELTYADTMQLTVYNAETNEALETFTFSRDPEAKAIDGSSLFVDDVVAGSAYIKCFNNPASTDVPSSTLAGSPLQASGGSNGGTITPSDMVRALNVFQDKTIPVSIFGNGCSVQAESPVYQQALLELANTRKDMFVFLNSQAAAEKATLPSARAQAIVDYKKGTLASTSFYGCMYAPHVNTPDVFNSRDVKIGADAVAIAGWLNVINSLNYPYAYAGPRNGLVQGVTCDWKIGDMSGEAEMLNDASVNYVAYDGKVGRYYMQCQNTLQIANSAMRNIGVVLNVLDIKENLVNYLKEFINLPITDSLRRDIMDTCNDFLAPMTGVRFYDYAFQDVATEADIAQDTLRYLLTLSPTRYAQRIYLVMNIVRTGFDFSILQSV